MRAKFDQFLPARSHFDSKRPENFVRIATFTSATFGPLFAFHCPLVFTKRAVYVNEDLTAFRAKLAFDARQLKKCKRVTKVVVKDLHNKIHEIKDADDMVRFT